MVHIKNLKKKKKIYIYIYTHTHIHTTNFYEASTTHPGFADEENMVQRS